MEKRQLGRTGIDVSVIGLGTMTWGEQNSEQAAFEQLDYAVGQGINLIDAAEMYPVPPRAETQGLTETYLGNWLKARGKRDDLVIATKVTGRSDMDYIRGGPRLTREQIHQAVNDSLQRLQTDYIDLYQVHWPERKANFFGKLGYNPTDDSDSVPIEETLAALNELVEAGKIRHIGLSNETAWGAMTWLKEAERKGWTRPVSIQNPYSLLNRSYEVGLAEVSLREDCGLLAYSPLAFGALSGKYLGGQKPAGARLTEFSRFSRYTSEQAQEAVQAYVNLAGEHGLSPAQMALAWVNSRSFLTSNLVGATTMEQLAENVESARIQLSDELLDRIETLHQRYTYPCP